MTVFRALAGEGFAARLSALAAAVARGKSMHYERHRAVVRGQKPGHEAVLPCLPTESAK
jgi:hypothetical protein